MPSNSHNFPSNLEPQHTHTQSNPTMQCLLVWLAVNYHEFTRIKHQRIKKVIEILRNDANYRNVYDCMVCACLYDFRGVFGCVFGAHIEYMKSAKENGVLIDSMMIADGFKAIQPKPMR